MMNLKNFNIMNRFFYLTLLLFSGIYIFAQDSTDTDEKKMEIDFGADLVSSYIWRGIQFSEGPNIQPGIALKKGEFECGIWGSSNFTTNFYEIDLFASYTLKGFTIGIVDYFLMDNNAINTKSNYFDYSKNTTNHFIELSIGYENPGKYPFRLMVSSFVYGADRDLNNNNYYATYIEFGYILNTEKLNFDFFIGGTINDNFVYLNDKGIIYLGFKVEKGIEINDKFSLPVYLSFVTNPVRENVFLVFGITI
jgi:hypothetical protein